MKLGQITPSAKFSDNNNSTDASKSQQGGDDMIDG
jgi:hypothetical protein